MSKPTPADRLFTDEHEWLKIKDSIAIIGISDHAQSSLGDVVYVELPDIGTRLEKGKTIGVIESVKAVSDIYAPASGIVKGINQDVLLHPEKINSSPYDEGWLLKIELTDVSETKTLLSAKQYEELLAKEAKYH